MPETTKDETWQVWSRKWIGALSPIATLLAALVAVYWAASPQLTLNQDTARRQLRAYLLYHEGHVEVSDGGGLVYKVALKNTGQTPAYNVVYSFNVGVREHAAGAELNPRRHFDFKPYGDVTTDLGAGGIMSLSRTHNHPEPFTPQENFYVWGQASFRDVYQRCHIVAFLAIREAKARSGPLEVIAQESSGEAAVPCDARGRATLPK